MGPRATGYAAGMLRRILVIAAALAAVAVAAPVALADDDSVYRAWTAHDDEFAQLGKDLRRQIGAWEDSHYRKGSKAIKTIDRTRATLAQVTSDVNAQQPSSDHGADGKKLALKSNAVFDASLAKMRKAIKLGMAGKLAKMRRARSEAEDLAARAIRYEKRARAAFKAAGVAVKSG